MSSSTASASTAATPAAAIDTSAAAAPAAAAAAASTTNAFNTPDGWLQRTADGELQAGPHSLLALAGEYGTPLYVYSREAIEATWQRFAQALVGRDARICYAVKANSNLAILALFGRLGAGFDVVSGGELARVVAAGGDPAKVVFSGVGKSGDEIRQALTAGIGCFTARHWRPIGRPPPCPIWPFAASIATSARRSPKRLPSWPRWTRCWRWWTSWKRPALPCTIWTWGADWASATTTKRHRCPKR